MWAHRRRQPFLVRHRLRDAGQMWRQMWRGRGRLAGAGEGIGGADLWGLRRGGAPERAQRRRGLLVELLHLRLIAVHGCHEITPADIAVEIAIPLTDVAARTHEDELAFEQLIAAGQRDAAVV